MEINQKPLNITDPSYLPQQIENKNMALIQSNNSILPEKQRCESKLENLFKKCMQILKYPLRIQRQFSTEQIKSEITIQNNLFVNKTQNILQINTIQQQKLDYPNAQDINLELKNQQQKNQDYEQLLNQNNLLRKELEYFKSRYNSVINYTYIEFEKKFDLQDKSNKQKEELIKEYLQKIKNLETQNQRQDEEIQNLQTKERQSQHQKVEMAKEIEQLKKLNSFIHEQGFIQIAEKIESKMKFYEPDIQQEFSNENSDLTSENIYQKMERKYLEATEDSGFFNSELHSQIKHYSINEDNSQQELKQTDQDSEIQLELIALLEEIVEQKKQENLELHQKVAFFDEIQNQNIDLQNKNEQSQAKILELEKQCQEIEQILAKKKEENLELHKQNEEKETNFNQIQNKNEQSEAKILELEKLHQEIEYILKKKNEENLEFDQKVKELKEINQQDNLTIEKLKTNLQEKNDNLVQNQTNYLSLQKQNEELSVKIFEMKQQHSEIQQRLDCEIEKNHQLFQINEVLREKEQIITQLNLKIKQMDEDFKKNQITQDENKKLAHQISELEKQRSQIKSNLQWQQQQNAGLNLKIENQQKINYQLNQKISQNQIDHNTLLLQQKEEKILQIQKQYKQYEQYYREMETKFNLEFKKQKSYIDQTQNSLTQEKLNIEKLKSEILEKNEQYSILDTQLKEQYQNNLDIQKALRNLQDENNQLKKQNEEQKISLQSHYEKLQSQNRQIKQQKEDLAQQIQQSQLLQQQLILKEKENSICDIDDTDNDIKYDLEIRMQSILDLQISQQDQNDLTQNFKDRNNIISIIQNDLNLSNKLLNIIGFIGERSKGKTFILRNLIGYKNGAQKYKKNQGISIKYQSQNGRDAIFIDNSGFNEPALMDYESSQNYKQFMEKKEQGSDNFSEFQNIQNEIITKNKFQKATELVQQGFTIQCSQILIIAVSKMTQGDVNLINSISQSFSQDRSRQRNIFVVHNLKHFYKPEQIENHIQEIQKVFTLRKLEIINFQQPEYEYNTIFIDNIDENVNHLFIAKEKTLAGNQYNKFAFDYLKEVIANCKEQVNFKPIQQLKQYLNQNIQKYLTLKSHQQNLDFKMKDFIDYDDQNQLVQLKKGYYIEKINYLEMNFGMFSSQCQYSLIQDRQSEKLLLLIQIPFSAQFEYSFKKKNGLFLITVLQNHKIEESLGSTYVSNRNLKEEHCIQICRQDELYKYLDEEYSNFENGIHQFVFLKEKTIIEIQ